MCACVCVLLLPGKQKDGRERKRETWRINIPRGAGVPLPSCQTTRRKNPPTELVGDEKNSQRTLNSWIVFLCGKKSRKFSLLFSIAAAAPFSLPPPHSCRPCALFVPGPHATSHWPALLEEVRIALRSAFAQSDPATK